MKKQIVHILAILVMIYPLQETFAAAEGAYAKSELIELIKNAEIKEQIPSGLLESIARIESGINGLAINIGGKSVFASNNEEAIRIVEDALSEGRTNIDIGIMQLNWRWHNKGFDNLNAMFSPVQNIKYAARLLKSLYKQHGDWHKAVRYYHSSNAEYYKKYSRKVVISWLNH